MTYERLRRARVERILAHGARTSNSKAVGPVARVLRDLMMPTILKRVANGGSLAWMHDYHIETGTRRWREARNRSRIDQPLNSCFG